MCGLYGWQFGPQIPLEKRIIVATVLGIHNESRGKDSWGAFNLETGEILKELGGATNGVHKFCQWEGALCHTRYATTGKVTVENAHPFIYKHIVGAHNGTVENHWQLNNNHKREFEVDSIHLFAHIADGMPKSEIRAYGAITYVDTRQTHQGGLYVCRFNGGVLSVYTINVIDDEGDEQAGAIIWSSTENAIEGALRMAGLTGFPWQVDEGKVYSISDYTLFKTPMQIGPDTPFVRRSRQAKGNVYVGYNTYYSSDNVTGASTDADTRKSIVWAHCCMCNRMSRTNHGKGSDEVCTDCEEIYKENLKAEEDAAKAEEPDDKLRGTEIPEEIRRNMPCDYCGTGEARFHIHEFNADVCVECFGLITNEVKSDVEATMVTVPQDAMVEEHLTVEPQLGVVNQQLQSDIVGHA